MRRASEWFGKQRNTGILITRGCARVLQATRDEEENANEEDRRRGEGRGGEDTGRPV